MKLVTRRDLTENVRQHFKPSNLKVCLRHWSLRPSKRIHPLARHPKHGGEVDLKIFGPRQCCR